MDGTLDTVAFSVVSPSSVFARVIYMFRPTSLFVVPFLACPSFIVSFPSWLRLVLRLSSIRRPVAIPSFICLVFVFACHGFIFPETSTSTY